MFNWQERLEQRNSEWIELKKISHNKYVAEVHPNQDLTNINPGLSNFNKTIVAKWRKTRNLALKVYSQVVDQAMDSNKFYIDPRDIYWIEAIIDEWNQSKTTEIKNYLLILNRDLLPEYPPIKWISTAKINNKVKYWLDLILAFLFVIEICRGSPRSQLSSKDEGNDDLLDIPDIDASIVLIDVLDICRGQLDISQFLNQK